MTHKCSVYNIIIQSYICSYNHFHLNFTLYINEKSFGLGNMFSCEDSLTTALIRGFLTHILARYVSPQNNAPKRNIGVYNQ